MGKMQRGKGANAEREVAKILQDYGYDARRGQVFNHEPDIVSNLPLHIEVKRQETIKIPEWYRQSEEASEKENKPPCVIFRKSREDWFICLKLKDFLEFKRKDKK